VKTFKNRITIHKTSRSNTFWLCNTELNLDSQPYLFLHFGAEKG